MTSPSFMVSAQCLWDGPFTEHAQTSYVGTPTDRRQCTRQPSLQRQLCSAQEIETRRWFLANSHVLRSGVSSFADGLVRQSGLPLCCRGTFHVLLGHSAPQPRATQAPVLRSARSSVDTCGWLHNGAGAPVFTVCAVGPFGSLTTLTNTTPVACVPLRSYTQQPRTALRMMLNLAAWASFDHHIAEIARLCSCHWRVLSCFCSSAVPTRCPLLPDSSLRHSQLLAVYIPQYTLRFARSTVAPWQGFTLKMLTTRHCHPANCLASTSALPMKQPQGACTTRVLPSGLSSSVPSA